MPSLSSLPLDGDGREAEPPFDPEPPFGPESPRSAFDSDRSNNSDEPQTEIIRERYPSTAIKIERHVAQDDEGVDFDSVLALRATDNADYQVIYAQPGRSRSLP